MLLATFIPLPVFAVAWQIVLGNWLPSWSLEPGQIAWRPWQRGLLPAAIVHGFAAVPWVVWIVSAVLNRTDPGLEDAARIDGGTGMLIRRVLLPRMALAIAVASTWVAVQAATEIPISDAMMVRTIAEEVYAEMVGNPAGGGAAVAIALPLWIASATIALVVLNSLRNRFPPASESIARTPSPQRCKWGVTAFAWLIVALVSGLPFTTLVWRAGGGSDFRFGFLVNTITTQFRDSGTVIVESLLAAFVAGLVTAILAWLVCTTLGRTRRGIAFLISFALVLWLVPGPIVGFGLKELILVVLDGEDAIFRVLGFAPAFPPLRSLLYDQPSPVPAILAAIVRLFPIAVAIILPSIRAVPTELWELARLDGLGSIKLLRRVLIPLTGSAVLRAGVAVAVLSLGEVSASKLVNPPARRAYILDLFNQMHYGAEATVAGLCLVQVAMTGLVLLVGYGLYQRSSFESRAVS